MLTIFPNKKGAEKADIFLSSFKSSTDADIFKAPSGVRDVTFNQLLLNDIRKKQKEIENNRKNSKKLINQFKRFIWHSFLKYYV